MQNPYNLYCILGGNINRLKDGIRSFKATYATTDFFQNIANKDNIMRKKVRENALQKVEEEFVCFHVRLVSSPSWHSNLSHIDRK